MSPGLGLLSPGDIDANPQQDAKTPAALSICPGDAGDISHIHVWVLGCFPAHSASAGITARNASRVCSIIATVCADDMNPASNCDGAR
jgi:hypothetical protein